MLLSFFFFSSRRRHTRLQGDWSSDVCSSDLRSHKAAIFQLLSDAIGSLNAIDTQLELALRLDYLTLVHHNCLRRAVDDCLALTYGLRKSLKNKSVSREKTVSTELSSQRR